MTQNLAFGQELFDPGLGREAVERIADRKGEPSWLRERRLEAWNIYEQTPVPTPAQREWKYTDITRLDFDRFRAFAAGASDGVWEQRRQSLGPALETHAGLLLQHDSVPVAADLGEAEERRGVIFCSLDEAVRRYPELVREHFMTRCVPAGLDKLTALHAALWSGGIFVYVPRGIELTLPLESLLFASTAGLAVFPHVLVIAEPQSRVTVIEQYESQAREGFALSDAVGEFVIGNDASVRYVNVQGWDTGTYHFSTHRALLGAGASLNYVSAGLGSRLSKMRSEAILDGRGANSEMLGLFFGERGQKFDAVTLQEHRGEQTKSDLLYKSALKDAAQSVYYGLVHVGRDARGTDANQENRNLLLSDRAKADSDPVLEILTSEVVRCSHGATVGPVDEEQLFYLQCRGLGRDEAERLLVEAFFAGVIQRVPVVQVRATLERAVRQRLAA